MFESKIDCPVAIADELGSSKQEGEALAAAWALDRAKQGDRLTMWVPLKSTINNNRILSYLESQSIVSVTTGRGGNSLRASGPVLAFYVHREDLSRFNNVQGMTALSVVTSMHTLNVWGEELGAEVLFRKQNSEFPSSVAPISDAAREELERVTSRNNTNNHLSSRYEKKVTVEALMRLRDQGALPEPGAAIEWAAAHGWRNDNPKILGEWVEKIADGRTLRH
ncbi:hypothetical protein NYP18_09110 [Corynebacterium sp. YIM 101645]|uniref:Uncharacterized protein n=1 Tax=Corynebacterium lemuris TaxID=1859292 RepID=A0ABT2FX47_9CORY|nr:hypothetical protein [Corynebacterium lemuris]MCS5479818.1 hypothetical protein [Corynebacterium lemuris]